MQLNKGYLNCPTVELTFEEQVIYEIIQNCIKALVKFDYYHSQCPLLSSTSCQQPGHWIKDCPNKKTTTPNPNKPHPQSSLSQNLPTVHCRCGVPSTVLPFLTQKNPNRKFYTCPVSNNYILNIYIKFYSFLLFVKEFDFNFQDVFVS